MTKSVLQDWVMELGLRHQGVIVSAIRGCDTSPKYSHTKTLSRYLRGSIMNAHCGDIRKAKTFMELPESLEQFNIVVEGFMDEHDMLPHHYVLHLIHAAEIVGYFRKDEIGQMWMSFYARMCKKMHVTAESMYELNTRLNKNEVEFFAEQKA